MGALLSLFRITAPTVIYAYNQRLYDPLSEPLNKLRRPGAALALQLPSVNKNIGLYTPSWNTLFTSPTYRAAWNDYRYTLYMGTDRIELDPVVYRDFRPGQSVQWQGGRHYNDSPFAGPMTMYDFMKANKTQGCPCE